MGIQYFFAGIGIFLTFAGYYLYIRDIFLGKTKPHCFSWFIWGLLMLIVFSIQIGEKAGPGALITGISSILAFGISIFSYFRKSSHIYKSDYLFLVGAIISLALWLLLDQPLLAILFLCITDGLGFIPTIRKSFSFPYQETLSYFFLNGIKFLFSFLAISNLTITTGAYPLFLVFLNLGLVIFILIRRKSASTSLPPQTFS